MIKREGSACDKCPLANCAYVPSVIPEGAILAAIGEAPGYQEVRAREPFVGPSGTLLQKALGALGTDFSKVARINAAGCKAEGNEVPYAALEACSGGLRNDLNRLPLGTKLLTLGGSATAAVDSLGGWVYTEGIMKRRGTWYSLDEETRYLATLHPAFILRSPGYMPQFYADLRKATNRIEPLDVSKVKYVVASPDNWEAIEAQLDRLPDATPVAFDIETGHLDLFGGLDRRPAWLLCIVITWRLDFSLIIPAEFAFTVSRKITSFLNRMTTIAHNGKFDQNGLAIHSMKVRLDHDTMLMSYSLNEQTKGAHGLKTLAAQLLDAPNYEDQFIEKWFAANGITKAKRRYDLLPKTNLYHYAAIDGVCTLALYHALLPKLAEDNVLKPYQMIMRHSALVQAAEFRGIKIDRPYLVKLETRLGAELEHYTEAMWDLLIKELGPNPVIGAPHYVKPKKLLAPFSPEPEGTKAFNPGSDDQMAWALYSVYRLRHIKPLSFKTKPTSTNEEALEALPSHPFVDLLRQHRRVSKIQSTYVSKLLYLADQEDRVHVNFNLHGTETGRLSADDSLHGIPRPEDFYGKAIQGSFIASPGFKFIKADFSQAELRAFAAESKEPFLLDQYRKGIDVHLATAKMLFLEEFKAINLRERSLASEEEELKAAKDRAKYLRQIAKQVNFGGLVYLGGPSGIAAMLHGYGIELTPAQLAPILNAYKAKMPTAIAWQQEQFRKAKREGEIVSRLGRKRRFLLITEDTVEEIRKASVNAPIQSVASDLNLIAAYEVQFELAKEEISQALKDRGIYVVHTVHDSIIAEAPEELAIEAAQIVKRIMERVASDLYPELPWVADVEILDRLYEGRPNL